MDNLKKLLSDYDKLVQANRELRTELKANRKEKSALMNRIKKFKDTPEYKKYVSAQKATSRKAKNEAIALVQELAKQGNKNALKIAEMLS